jgi:hypothetical protein
MNAKGDEAEGDRDSMRVEGEGTEGVRASVSVVERDP